MKYYLVNLIKGVITGIMLLIAGSLFSVIVGLASGITASFDEIWILMFVPLILVTQILHIREIFSLSPFNPATTIALSISLVIWLIFAGLLGVFIGFCKKKLTRP